LNVGSGGGAAPVAAGGAPAAGDAAAPAEEEKKKEEEGTTYHQACEIAPGDSVTNIFCREGRVRRGHGFRSFRLNSFRNFPVCTFKCMATVCFPSVQYWVGRLASIEKQAYEVSSKKLMGPSLLYAWMICEYGRR
jgi:hypothetical protein